MTVMPRLTSSRQMAAPIPTLAPVTRATRPAQRSMLSDLSRSHHRGHQTDLSQESTLRRLATLPHSHRQWSAGLDCSTCRSRPYLPPKSRQSSLYESGQKARTYEVFIGSLSYGRGLGLREFSPNKYDNFLNLSDPTDLTVTLFQDLTYIS